MGMLMQEQLQKLKKLSLLETNDKINDLINAHDNQALDTIKAYKFTAQANGSPESWAEGLVIIYRADDANYSWMFAICNGNIYTRDRANGNWKSWKYPILNSQ